MSVAETAWAQGSQHAAGGEGVVGFLEVGEGDVEVADEGGGEVVIGYWLFVIRKMLRASFASNPIVPSCSYHSPERSERFAACGGLAEGEGEGQGGLADAADADQRNGGQTGRRRAGGSAGGQARFCGRRSDPAASQGCRVGSGRGRGGGGAGCGRHAIVADMD